MAFVHALQSPSDSADAGCVIATAQDRQLARLDADGTVRLPAPRDLAGWMAPREPHLHLGRLDGAPCWLCAVDGAPPEAPAGWSWLETRALLQTTTPAQAQAIACARQLGWWRARSRFCGGCGAPTIDATEERARRCTACGAVYFPSAAPAVIVAVTRGDRLLLAHNRNWRSGMFSVLAGFLEPGETFEQAAAREIREEAGIEIGELRYVTSQPWPFPNSLMAGFRAVHLGGEIAVDDREITEAGWFARDALPDIPRHGTIARELIEGWRRESH